MLSGLIKKGGLLESMTATAATTATHDSNRPVTVATVATVAVAKQPVTVPELCPVQEASIRAWLAFIGESDPGNIDALLDSCRIDLKTRQYFQSRSEEVPKPGIFTPLIACGACINFKRIDHPHLGHCTLGQPENIAGLWDDDERLCHQFLPLPKLDGDHHD